MKDKVVFICLVLNNAGETFSWDKMYVNVTPEIIHDEIYDIVLKFEDMTERTIHMKHYGFNDDADEFLETHYGIISEAIHG